MVKIQRWKDKLFNALVDPKDANTISDIENGCLLLSDLVLRALFSIYCAKGNDFDQFVFKYNISQLFCLWNTVRTSKVWSFEVVNLI